MYTVLPPKEHWRVHVSEPPLSLSSFASVYRLLTSYYTASVAIRCLLYIYICMYTFLNSRTACPTKMTSEPFSFAAIPRRASAYDVYHKRGSDAGSLSATIGKEGPGSRRSSFRTPSPSDKDEALHIDARRRSSCRPPGSSDPDDPSTGRRQSMKPKTVGDISGT